MAAAGPLVTLEAKPGKEDDLASLLESALPLAEREPQTTAWFAVRSGPSRFAIFDTFPDESGRKAPLAGQVAAALMYRAPNLLATSPNVERIDVPASKLP